MALTRGFPWHRLGSWRPRCIFEWLAQMIWKHAYKLQIRPKRRRTVSALTTPPATDKTTLAGSVRVEHVRVLASMKSTGY